MSWERIVPQYLLAFLLIYPIDTNYEEYEDTAKDLNLNFMLL